MRARPAVFAAAFASLTCGPAPALAPISTSVCASGLVWNGGDADSPLMKPGHACLACHGTDRGPRFAVAGTVYGAAHEANDCGGEAMGVRVEVIDADGGVHALTPNAAGNFILEGAIALPYRARLVHRGGVREMAAPQTQGDCNACHTAAGSEGAPGRIAP